MDVPADRGLTFYQVLTLASIVEREAMLDEERPLIAGVYQNRHRRHQGHQEQAAQRRPDGLLRDRHGRARQARRSTSGRTTRSGPRPGVALADVRCCPRRCRATRPTRRRASSRGRSARRASPSIDAALEPDTADKYIYFLAIPDGGGKHAFAKTAGGAPGEPEEVRLHPVTALGADGWPIPADFARPPTAAQHAAGPRPTGRPDPARLARLRARFADAGVDAYFGVRREHMRYLTGFTLADGEEKVAGNSGQFLVGGDEVVVLADSRYTIQARTRGARRRDRRGLQRPARAAGRSSSASVGARRVGGRGRLRAARDLGTPRGGRPGRRARPGRGLDRGGPGDEGAGRARADRGRLRRRRSGAGRAAAGDPPGRHRGRARARASSG